MENYHLVNTPIVARATKFIIPFNRQATVKDTKLYRLKIGSLIYLTRKFKIKDLGPTKYFIRVRIT